MTANLSPLKILKKIKIKENAKPQHCDKQISSTVKIIKMQH